MIVRLNSSEADHWGHHAWRSLSGGGDRLSITGMVSKRCTCGSKPMGSTARHGGCKAAGLAELERVWDPCKGVSALAPLGDPRFVARPSLLAMVTYCQPVDSTLALPEPQALQSIGCSVLCLGNINPSFEQPRTCTVWDPTGALTVGINTHQIAQWLHRCLEEKLSIVRFPASPFEEKNRTWEALVKSHHPAPSVLFPKSPLGVGDILDELSWHKQNHPSPTLCVTPAPETRCIYRHETRRPEVAVCVSLYNYANTITSALNSAATQSNVDQLELIVVDDGSTDESRATAEQWLKNNGQRFARCLLLEHTKRRLAAARNTAFEAVKSSGASYWIRQSAREKLQVIVGL